MANRPSARTNRVKPAEGLNLTPFIDMITCLMFFLMMFAGIIPVVIIDAPLPKVASTADEVRKAQDDKNKLEIMLYLNPNEIKVKTIPGLGDRAFAKLEDGKFPWEEVHKFLVDIKVKKPDIREITLMPSDDTAYEMMIEAMDSSRELQPKDAGYQSVPAEIAQKPESQQFNRLFPDVSIGGI